MTTSHHVSENARLLRPSQELPLTDDMREEAVAT